MCPTLQGIKDLSDVANLLRVLDIAESAGDCHHGRIFSEERGPCRQAAICVKTCAVATESNACAPLPSQTRLSELLRASRAKRRCPNFLIHFIWLPLPRPWQGNLADTPPLTGDERLDALAGAIADYLARQYRLLKVPDWAFEPERFLDRPWHVSPFDSDEMREYLTFSSPAEFRSRNIFTEERPLRRARAPLAK